MTLFTSREQETWKPPPEETIDEWAERAIVLPRIVSQIPGPLSFDFTPYLREPLRTVLDPGVDQVSWCSSAQVAKTTFLLVVIFYYLANDPWNSFIVLPTEDEARELKEERFLPIIRESPELRSLIVNERTDFSGDTIRLNGCTSTFRGSNSPSGLASKPAKIAIADEIDKYRLWAGNEADPIALLKERLKSFYDSKFLCASTPITEDHRIWRQLQASSNERYNVPCPLCGRYQVLVFGDGTPGTPGIKWPEGLRDPERISGEELAWYECMHCHRRIDETEKRGMVSRGVWSPQGVSVTPDGELATPRIPHRHRGYHIWSAYSLWPKSGWSQIAAEFLRSKDRPQSLMNFRNSWQGEPWSVAVAELRDVHVRATQSDYWVGEIPDQADAVTFGIDVQSAGNLTYHYYVVRAWGPGGESWLVRYGTTIAKSRDPVAGWAGINSIVFETEYKTPGGKQLMRIQPLVDSGYRTSEVYDWCFERSGIATKGDARSRKHLVHSEIERAPGSEDLVQFISFNPNYYKTELHRRIKSSERWHLPREMDEEYFAHMVAEQLTRTADKRTGHQKYEWRLRSEGLANHYFDCEVLCLVGADLAELAYRSQEPVRPKTEADQERRQLTVQSGYTRVFS